MQRLIGGMILVSGLLMGGCAEDTASSMVEDVDAAEIANFKAMVKASEADMERGAAEMAAADAAAQQEAEGR